MRTFEKPNLSNNWKCPICGTSEEKEVVLVAIDGTQDSNNIQANQYHLGCIHLLEYNDEENNNTVLATRFRRKDK